jgi:hypothetical protein
VYVCIPQSRQGKAFSPCSRPNWDHPPRHPQAACPPFVSAGGGGAYLLARERGGPNSDEGTETVVPLCGVYLFTMYTRSLFCSQQCCKRPVKFRTLDGKGYTFRLQAKGQAALHVFHALCAPCWFHHFAITDFYLQMKISKVVIQPGAHSA